MELMKGQTESIAPEQRIYARWLAAGSRASFVLLVAAFILYLTGAVPALVPIEELPQYWGLSAARYAAATGTPTGWRWLGFLGWSDVLNLAGIACVASVTLVCFARLLPEFVRQREYVYTAIVLMELWVLAAAASGIAA